MKIDKRCKLTAKIVQAIRAKCGHGHTRKSVAERYKTSMSNLDAILARRTWKKI